MDENFELDMLDDYADDNEGDMIEDYGWLSFCCIYLILM